MQRRATRHRPPVSASPCPCYFGFDEDPDVVVRVVVEVDTVGVDRVTVVVDRVTVGGGTGLVRMDGGAGL